jgi:hypothetical protein
VLQQYVSAMLYNDLNLLTLLHLSILFTFLLFTPAHSLGTTVTFFY